MDFRDMVNQNLRNAPSLAKQAEEAQFQKTVESLCQKVRDEIIYQSKNHTNPRIPFRVEMYLAVSSTYAFKRLSHTEHRPGWFNPTCSIDEFQILDELVILQKAVKSQLSRDGIHVGEWAVSTDGFSSDDNGYRGTFKDCQLHTSLRKLETLNINPNAKFTMRTYQVLGATSPHYKTELSQGNVRYDLRYGYSLICKISYPG